MPDERDEYTRQLDNVWLEGTDGEGQCWRLDDIVFTRAAIVPVHVELPMTLRELPMTFTTTVKSGDAEWARRLFAFFSPAARAGRKSEAAVWLFHRQPSWWMLGYAMRQAFLSAWYESTRRR